MVWKCINACFSHYIIWYNNESPMVSKMFPYQWHITVLWLNADQELSYGYQNWSLWCMGTYINNQKMKKKLRNLKILIINTIMQFHQHYIQQRLHHCWLCVNTMLCFWHIKSIAFNAVNQTTFLRLSYESFPAIELPWACHAILKLWLLPHIKTW